MSAAERAAASAMLAALKEIVNLQMGRGDGVVGDYMDEVRETARAAIAAAEIAGIKAEDR